MSTTNIKKDGIYFKNFHTELILNEIEIFILMKS